MPGPVSGEVLATEFDAIMKEGRILGVIGLTVALLVTPSCVHGERSSAWADLCGAG